MEPGERVSIKDREGQCRGTVRYIGNIHAKEGIWVGVEWDDPERGKHDGSLNGHRYFQCQRSPPSASFIRQDKVVPGVALVNAIQDRYTPDIEGDLSMHIDTARHKHLTVTLAGSEKVKERLQHLSLIDTMTLHDSRIARVGDEALLRAMFPNVEYLGLADNLLGGWQHVHTICSALPALCSADFSGNRLQQSDVLLARPPLRMLRTLVLNACHLEWADIVRVAHAAPALRELCIAENHVSTLSEPLPEGAFGELQLLDLQDNALRGWEAVQPLALLPALAILKLSGNAIDAISNVRGFKSLRSLLLGGCGIVDWTSIDALSALPQLRHLRVTENPVLVKSNVGGRCEVIARLANLVALNGANVGKMERRDSEIQYLRHALQRVADAGEACKDAEAARHPRLQELVKEHGRLEVVPSSSAGKLTGASSSFVRVAFVLDGTDIGEAELVTLPRSTCIGHVKLLCRGLFGIDTNTQELVLESGERSGEVIEDDNSVDLAYWNLEHGDRIRVVALDPGERWASCAGIAVDSVPDTWLLPPEFRQELANMVTA